MKNLKNLPTDARVGQHIRQVIDAVLPVVVATYVVGETCGMALHRLNDRLARAYVRLLGLKPGAERRQPDEPSAMPEKPGAKRRQPSEAEHLQQLAAIDGAMARIRRVRLQRQAWAQQGRQYAQTVRQRRRWAEAQTVATLRRIARKHGMERAWCRVARKGQLVHHYGHRFAMV